VKFSSYLPRLDEALGFGILNHGESHPVFHATTRLHAFHFHCYGGFTPLHHLVQIHKGSLAYELEPTVVRTEQSRD
jgi:hypothetical protein